MISMDFLKRPVGGLEFINFQSSDFYRKMVTFLESQISPDGVLSKEAIPGIKSLIEEYTGFKNIDMKLSNSGNFSVDVGYFSPNHVFNHQLADELLKPTQSTLYRWFTQNKDKVFKGGIDYSTGKVQGSFQTLPVTFLINPDLSATFPADKIKKFGVPLAGILAGAIAHECGHVFSGCMMLLTVASDNLYLKASLQYYRGANDASDRVVVLKDIASLLDVPPAKQGELQKLAQDQDDKTLFLYFDKLIAQRNMRRSLSVGVEAMSSEVVADMYAIRMGCEKGVIAAIGILTDQGCIQTVVNGLLIAAVVTLVALPGWIALTVTMGIAGALFTAMVFYMFIFVMSYFSKGYSGVYNADHRRFEDAVRQLIQKLKEDTSMPEKDKLALANEVQDLLVHANNLRPWYESTVIHRFMGWVFSQADFKAQEVEHYTSVIANHEVNTIAVKLANLKARRDPEGIEA
jgi:hypothetical protein